MRRFTFTANTQVRIGGSLFRIFASSSDGRMQLIDSASNIFVSYERWQLLEKWEKGDLVFDDMQLVENSRRGRGPTASTGPIDDFRKKDKDRLNQRADFLLGMSKRSRDGWQAAPDDGGPSEFEKALVEVSILTGFEATVSSSTYYRWCGLLQANNDVADLRGEFARRGREQMDTAVREIVLDVMRSHILAAQRARAVGDTPFTTMAAMKLEIRTRVDIENEKRRSSNRLAAAENRPLDVEPMLQAPRSPATYYDHWNVFSAYDRTAAMRGPAQARADFRGRHGYEAPRASLDVCQYDETYLPFLVFDELLGIPLGRPWFSWFVCQSSSLPIGLYLGFEQVSDVSILSALRSACLPKAYVLEEYRNIENPYVGAGIPRHMTFDNPLSQHGQSVRACARDLNSEIWFAPSYTPWFKALVESMFNALNVRLLQQIPGFVAKGIAVRDYDPRAHGCIGLRHLMQIIWKWLCDVYQVGPQGPLDEIPRERFLEGCKIHEPDFLARSSDLDLVFAVQRAGKLTSRGDHRGVLFMGEWYYSDEFHEMRLRYGDKLTVQVKVKPWDLGDLYVRIKPDTPWVRALALNQSYMRGRGLRHHEICRSVGKRQSGSDDVAAWRSGEQQLQSFIHETVAASASLKFTSLAASIFGLGSQHVTAALDHDGRLGEMGGPFAGHALAAPTPQEIISIKSGVPSPSVRQLPPPASQPIEVLPDFDVDLSIGRG